jgi:hypothetical protein
MQNGEEVKVQQGIYAVYDCKAEAFAAPAPVKTEGLARRSFGGQANDPDSQLNQYPQDFRFYCIAMWDERTGKFENLPEPKDLGLARDYITAVE